MRCAPQFQKRFGLEGNLPQKRLAGARIVVFLNHEMTIGLRSRQNLSPPGKLFASIPEFGLALAGQYAPAAFPGATTARVHPLQRRRVALLDDQIVVVSQFLAGLEIAYCINVHMSLFFKSATIGIATVVDPA